MAQPVTVKIKFAGKYAEKLRVEAASRRLKLAPLAAEYAMRGMDLKENDDSDLVRFERRIAATILASRSDLEAVQAELDTVAAMLDTFVKLMLVHLPEPGTEKEATQASALARYERFIQQVGMAFEGDRPQALKKIGELIQKRIETAEENQ
jgi:hypothetical protein